MGVGFDRSLRGGSWLNDNATYLRSGARYNFAPAARGINLGFRCAGTLR